MVVDVYLSDFILYDKSNRFLINERSFRNIFTKSINSINKSIKTPKKKTIIPLP